MILITGATGFLGHNLIPRLLQAGYQVRAVVRPSSDTRFLQTLGVDLVVIPDITDRAALTQACTGCHSVIHAAGHFRFWDKFPTYWHTNVAGTQAILTAATAAQVQRFVHISTLAVIGRPPISGPIDEQTRCFPQDHYQRTKLEGESLALNFHRDQGLPVIVLRPGWFYGPWGRYAFNRLNFEEPLRGWRIKVDNGRHILCPVYINDVAQATQLALTAGQPGHIYNISGHVLDQTHINAIISDLSGIGHWRINIPKPVVLNLARAWTLLARFTGHEPFYPITLAPYVFEDWRVSTAKAEAELGFTPTPFIQGAKETLDWYWGQGILGHHQPSKKKLSI